MDDNRQKLGPTATSGIVQWKGAGNDGQGIIGKCLR